MSIGLEKEPFIPPAARLAIFVEGFNDKIISDRLLRKAGINTSFVEFVMMDGNHNFISEKFIKRLRAFGPTSADVQILALIDSYYGPSLKERLSVDGGGDAKVDICVANPEIEAWLLSDSKALKALAPHEKARRFADDLPLPDQIPFPRDVLKHYISFEGKEFWKLIDAIDISVAAARSPSLRAFITAVASRLGVEVPPVVEESYSRNINRDLISNLIAEVTPADAPVFRAADGSVYTAGDMVRHIRDGSAIGQQYASDLLRVSRDMLARQARKPG